MPNPKSKSQPIKETKETKEMKDAKDKKVIPNSVGV
jgi:hypothetical protein